MGRDDSMLPQLCCSGGGRWELAVSIQILLLQALWQTLRVPWQSCDQSVLQGEQVEVHL